MTFSIDSTTSVMGMIVLIAKATLLLLAALGATAVLQRASAGARHLVWVGIVGAILVLPALSAWSPLRLAILPAAIVASGASITTEPASPPASEVDTRRIPFDPVAGTNVALPARSGAQPPAAPALSGWQLALRVWAVAAAGLCAWLIFGFLSVRRIVRRGRVLEGRDWSGPLYEIADRLGMDEAPRLIRSDDVKMPFACGLVAPTIVLPADSDSWIAERRSAVLMHELAHIKRRDLLGHTLGRLACAIYWFHPLVWTAARRLRIESERACDDLALTCGLKATNYAEHLLDIVSNIRQPHTPMAAIPMAHRREFEGRMLAILDPDLRRHFGRWQSLSLVGGLAALVVVVGGAVPASRAQALDGEVAAANAPQGATNLANDGPRQGVVLPLAPDSPRMPTREPRTTERQTRLEERKESSTQATSEGANVELPAALQPLLQSRGKEDRATLLIGVLRSDTSASLRRVAAWGLSSYADRDHVGSALAVALRRDTNASVREMAAWSLAGGQDRRDVMDALSEALRRDSDIEVREVSAWALGSLGAEGAVDALTAALSDASAAIRKTALWALGSTEHDKAPRGVLDALNDQDKGVRYLAAWALFNIADPAAVPALEAALNKETEKSLRVAYIRALGSIGDESADALARLIDSRDPDVRSVVVSALAGRAGGPWPMPMPRPRPQM
ncbi:MAG: M56 family metallopeptidase [Gemmatimonadaceae bacterium]